MADDRRPAEVFHPGVLIRDEMEARGWSIDTLVQESLMGRVWLEEIIAGTQSVTAISAMGLSRAFGGEDMQLWLDLQTAYDKGAKAHITKE